VDVVGGTRGVLAGFVDTTPTDLAANNPTNLGNLYTSAGDGKYTNFDQAVIKSAYTFQKWDYTEKIWKDIDVEFSAPQRNSTTYPAGGYVDLTFPQSEKYDIIRYNVDPYKIVEKTAVLGYKHRANNDASSFDPTTSWTYLGTVIDTTVADDQFYQFTANNIDSLVFSGVPGAYYLTVRISDSSISGSIVNYVANSLIIDKDSLLPSKNKDGIRVLYTPAGVTADRERIPLEDSQIQVIGRNEFRINLPSTFVN
jgi:hypothetical protein